MMRLKSALVVVNPTKPCAKLLASEVRRFLAANNIRVVKRAAGASMLITIGGDGTLLYNKSKFQLPIFAIGSERSSICQSTAKNWKVKLQRILARGFTTEKRMMLECKVDGRKVEDALNDVVIRSRNHRVITLKLNVGARHFSFCADGVLFSTPTGSTAYCYSCGGSELPRHARRYEVVAVAPYRRAFKPQVIQDSTACSVVVKTSNADLVFDGQFVRRVKAGSKIGIRKSRENVMLIRA